VAEGEYRRKREKLSIRRFKMIIKNRLHLYGNYLGRGQTIYGDTGTPSPTFGQLAAVGTATNAIPAFANVDPPRMFHVQVRFSF
jgi:hypothetical protein